MQYLSALARHRLKLAAAGAFILGALLLGQIWIGHTTIAPTAESAPAEDLLATAPEDGAEPPGTPAGTPSAEAVIVYISGAVRAPDVYQLPGAARIKDVVLAAGGLAPEADAERINMAERLTDGQHIHIPRQGEAPATQSAVDGGTAGAAGPGEPINLNTAVAAELDSLPGIGQALAQRIVEYRTANGPFKSVEDLRNV